MREDTCNQYLIACLLFLWGAKSDNDEKQDWKSDFLGANLDPTTK